MSGRFDASATPGESRPKLLVLDEPSLGLPPLVCLKISDVLRTLKLAHRASVLLADSKIKDAYLGE